MRQLREPAAPPAAGPAAERLRFETLLADLAVGFCGVAPEQVDTAIEAAQRAVCECLDLDRFSLWQTDPADPEDLRLTHAYRRQPVTGPGATSDHLPAPPRGSSGRELFPWLVREIGHGVPVTLPDADALPAAAEVDRESFRLFGYRAAAVVPVLEGRTLVGALSLVSTSGARDWDPSLFGRVAAAGKLFTASLARMRSEAALRRSEARLAAAVALADLGFYDTAVGRSPSVFADRRLREMVGAQHTAPAEFMAFWESRLHQADRDTVLALREDMWCGRVDGINIEYRFHHPERGVVWLSHVASVSERDAAGRASRILGVVQDITERTRDHAALAEQLRFESVLSEVSAALIGAPPDDLDGEISALLGRAARALGAERAALIAVTPDGGGRVSHRWLADGLAPMAPDEDMAEAFPWLWARHTTHRQAFAFADLAELPAAAAKDRDTLAAAGIASGQAVPVPDGAPPRLVIVLNSMTAGRACTPELTSRLRLLGEVFLSALDRRRATLALERSLAEIGSLKTELELENRYLREEHSLKFGRGQIVGESRAISEVLAAVEQVAPQHTTVLIEGETGVGKELIARRIHELSPRGRRPLVKVNCAALPSTLVESELFGREKGAFTGSVSRELGRFEIANGSTIFLDEVGELPLELQSKLLRVLEEGEFERVGSPRTLQTDARVIAATNRNLEEEVRAGRFRRDLYYRLSAFPIRVPPLRERREDIPLLMWAIVEELAAAMHKEIKSVPRRTVDALKLYDWPGNVRELRNVVERAMIRANGPSLVIDVPGVATTDRGPSASLDEAQRRHIERVLAAAGGRVGGPGGAAELLGLKRTTLNSLMKRLGISHRTAGRRQP